MPERDPRAAELLGAALAGDLTPEEAGELAAACERDPGLRAELDELGAAADELRGSGVRWADTAPPPDLGARVRDVTRREDVGRAPAEPLVGPSAATPVGSTPSVAGTPGGEGDVTPRRAADPGQDVGDDGSGRGAVSRPAGPGTGEGEASAPAAVVPLRQRRRPAVLLAAAAAGLVVGIGGTLLGSQLAAAPPSGPPGTLGAVEEVEFAGERPGSVVDGAVVAHTWGTETLLEVDGTTVGQTFRVVVVDRDGEEFTSGAFVGSTQTVVCRMNAAVLREDAAEVRIEGPEQQLLASAALEPVS